MATSKIDGNVTDEGKTVVPHEAVKAPGNEEPEPVSEPDLASDGRDEEGEAMIRDLRPIVLSSFSTQDDNQPAIIGERNPPTPD